MTVIECHETYCPFNEKNRCTANYIILKKAGTNKLACTLKMRKKP